MEKKLWLLILFVMPYLFTFQACKQGEKTEAPYDYQRTVTMEDKPSPTGNDENTKGYKDGTVDRTAPSTTMNELKQKTDVKLVNLTEPNQDFNTQDKRMIVRSGTMSMEVDKYDDTEAKVREIVKGVNGYLTNSSSTLNPNGKKQGSITIRVASDRFDALLGELSKAGKVMNQNISGKDVTEEYMDSEARLKTQRELESRLLKLLSEKTANLTSVVEVEQKLSAVRENIERTEGRMRYLKDQASFSSLTLSIYEPSLLETSTGGGFFYELGESVKRGLKGFTSVISGMITVIIALSPILAIGGLIIYLVVRYVRKKKTVKTA